jgi:L-alanine-DL-glutamate epimerase-like enolase superfamily enzyme
MVSPVSAAGVRRLQDKAVVRSARKKLNMRLGGTRIDEAIVHELKIPLQSTFTTSLGPQYFYDAIVIELHSDRNVGYGEGTTVPRITGETSGTMYEAATYLLDRFEGRTFEGLESFIDSTNSLLRWNPTAKCALDIAAHEIIAKQVGVHVTRLLGGSLTTRETSRTIDLGDVKSAISELEGYLKAGAKMIKLKVGGDIGTDIKRVRAVAERLGEVPFYVDANQGYKLRDALVLSRVLLDKGALFFEQPLYSGDFDSLRFLRTTGGVPVMLDESIFDPRDVIDAIRKEAADYVNVKLAKSGGIRRSLKTLATAQGYGIEAMIGCMLESKLGIAASLATVSAASNVRFTDLDGFLYLRRQPFEGGVRLSKGANTLLEGNGLAVKKIF